MHQFSGRIIVGSCFCHHPIATLSISSNISTTSNHPTLFCKHSLRCTISMNLINTIDRRSFTLCIITQHTQSTLFIIAQRYWLVQFWCQVHYIIPPHIRTQTIRTNGINRKWRFIPFRKSDCAIFRINSYAVNRIPTIAQRKLKWQITITWLIFQIQKWIKHIDTTFLVASIITQSICTYLRISHVNFAKMCRLWTIINGYAL